MCKINGKKLGELRTKLGYSQRALATELGVSQTMVGFYERGVSEPSSETLDKICMILRISRDEVEIHDVGYIYSSRESRTVHNERNRLKKMGLPRFATPSEVECFISENRVENEEKELKEVSIAMSNSFGIGKKRYILINPTFLHIPEWQRDTDMAKVKEISENYDESKFDPVKLYLVDGKLKVADGAHRVAAFVINEEMKIMAEVLSCDEQNAVLTFLGQSAARKAMTICDMYRAGVKANIEDYINLKNFFEEKNIQISVETDKIQNPIGIIRPSSTLIRMLRSDKEMLEKVIDLIRELEWNGSEKNAYTVRNIQVLRKMISQFGTDVEEKLLNKCKGASFYESKVAPIYKNAELFDILSAEISN